MAHDTFLSPEYVPKLSSKLETSVGGITHTELAFMIMQTEIKKRHKTIGTLLLSQHGTKLTYLQSGHLTHL
jgi:hypothetical protein